MQDRICARTCVATGSGHYCRIYVTRNDQCKHYFLSSFVSNCGLVTSTNSYTILLGYGSYKVNDFNSSNNIAGQYSGYATWFFNGNGYINFTTCTNNTNNNGRLTWQDVDGSDIGHLYLTYSNYVNNPQCSQSVIYTEDKLPIDISYSNFVNNVASYVFYSSGGFITVQNSYCPASSKGSSSITIQNLVASKIVNNDNVIMLVGCKIVFVYQNIVMVNMQQCMSICNLHKSYTTYLPHVFLSMPIITY